MFKPIIAGVFMASLSCIASAAAPAGGGPHAKDSTAKSDLVAIQTGADLYDRCGELQTILKIGKPDAHDATLKADACLNYVHGFLDGEQINALINAMRQAGVTAQTADATGFSAFCVPGQMQQGDVVKQLLAYIGRHPEQRSKPVAAVMYAALVEAYPCPVR